MSLADDLREKQRKEREAQTSQLPPSNAIIEVGKSSPVDTKSELQKVKEDLELAQLKIKLDEAKKLRDLPEVLKAREAELNKREASLNDFAKRLEDREQALVLAEEDVKNRREDADRYYALRVKQAKEFTPQVQAKPKIKEIDYTRYR
jgi:predicted phage tail protein